MVLITQSVALICSHGLRFPPVGLAHIHCFLVKVGAWSQPSLRVVASRAFSKTMANVVSGLVPSLPFHHDV